MKEQPLAELSSNRIKNVGIRKPKTAQANRFSNLPQRTTAVPSFSYQKNQSVGMSLARAYRETVLEKKRLLENETQLRARLNYELQTKMSEQKKDRIEGWRSEYLKKYKHMTASTDNLFKLTNPAAAYKKQACSSLSRSSSLDLFPMNLVSGYAQMNRIRVENIKREHLKHQKLIVLRRQQELQRKVESANAVKREKIEAKENLKRFQGIKKTRMASVVSDKISKERMDERSIQERISRINQFREDLISSTKGSQPSNNSRRLLFRKIL